MRKIILLFAAASLISSCKIYRNFETPECGIESQIVGEGESLAAESPVKLPSWKEFFTDNNLQLLIEKGLESNADIKIARVNIESSKTMLLTSKLAYLPSIGINSATGSTSSFGGNALGQAYNLPISASWELDLFGRIKNSKDQAKANLLMSEQYARLTELEITTLIANSYYTLIMLDEQIAIANEFIENQTKTLNAMRSLKEVGSQTETAVNQAEASLYSTYTTKKDLEYKLALVENTISLLINEPPHAIARTSYNNVAELSGSIDECISLETLSNRPDVKAAEYSLSSSFYGANIARSAIYPRISLSGSAGWTNSVGGIVNPGDLLLSAIGSLTAPIFNRNVNRANLNVAKNRYEQSLIGFEKALLKAGNEVNGLLAEQELMGQKRVYRKKQVEANKKAYQNSKLLMEHSTSTYLDVLISEASYLSSRLTDVGEWMVDNQCTINLYKALGGDPK